MKTTEFVPKTAHCWYRWRHDRNAHLFQHPGWMSCNDFVISGKNFKKCKPKKYKITLNFLPTIQASISNFMPNIGKHEKTTFGLLQAAISLLNEHKQCSPSLCESTPDGTSWALTVRKDRCSTCWQERRVSPNPIGFGPKNQLLCFSREQSEQASEFWQVTGKNRQSEVTCPKARKWERRGPMQRTNMDLIGWGEADANTRWHWWYGRANDNKLWTLCKSLDLSSKTKVTFWALVQSNSNKPEAHEDHSRSYGQIKTRVRWQVVDTWPPWFWHI